MSRAPSQREMGPQPLAELLLTHGLERADVVAASTEQLTHKQVARAAKGRWLTPLMRAKLLRAMQAATGEALLMEQLFDYAEARDAPDREGPDAPRT